MEASALQAPVGLARLSLSAPLLKLRSDEQLLALFRAGNEEAFRVIHDRYQPRLFAYSRQMLAGSRQDAEDVLQDVFIRAYGALRSNNRPVALRAWLYRVAHNRCIDQLRRPLPPAADLWDVTRAPVSDPLAEAERRDDLKRLIADVRRLPEQQRSVLLMREMEGLSYAELAEALEASIPAVKSLLVRARMGLVESAEARDTACAEIRRDLTLAHGRGVRATGRARRHMRDCAGCRAFRHDLRRVQRSFAALTPVAAGPLGLLAKLGLGGGGSAGGGAGAATAGGGAATAGGGAMAGSGAAAGSTIAGTGAAALSAGKVAAVVSAVVVAGGGAVKVEQTIVEHAQKRAAPTVSPAPAKPPNVRESAAKAVEAPAKIVPPVTVVPETTAAEPEPAVTDVPAEPAEPSAPVSGEDTAGTGSSTSGGMAAPAEPAETGAPTEPAEPTPREALAPGTGVTAPLSAGGGEPQPAKPATAGEVGGASAS